ncbi:hypothetical protein ACJIZ3_014198 [Penstemon smallii]|uniref:LRAT domain-containing protein n=1 Tax=Penstemon smallii TaxID=265156 RepID=A0ABD3RIV5_9LAMI
MGLLSHRVERSDIVAGDHIYSWRTSFLYSHHGIFFGENIVIHFTNDDPTIKSKSNDRSSFITCTSSTPSITCTSTCAITKLQTTCSYPKYCGFRKQDSGVKISCLDCFLGNGSLYLYQYDVAWYYLIAKIRGGTCTTAKSDPPEIVFRRAMYLLLDHGFGEFDLLENNCEDFALYCKTGRLLYSRGERVGGSGQVSSVVGVPTSVAVGFFLSGPVALATTAALYSFNRYSIDLIYRLRGIKVAVEDLAKFRANGNRPMKKD